MFVDGHADFYHPEANPNGQAASMDLALAANGRGPELVSNIEGRRPLVRDEDVVVLGYRDAEEQASYGSQPLPPAIRAIDLVEFRRRGVDVAAQDAVGHLTRSGGAQELFPGLLLVRLRIASASTTRRARARATTPSGC